MKKTIAIILIIFIVLISSNVYATSGKISLESSLESIEKGKTFTVTIKGEADNSITALQGKLSYDKSKLAIEDKKPGNGFSELSGNDEIAVTVSGQDSLSKKASLYTITFKVLDTATQGDAKISVENAVMALINEQSVQENTEEINSEITIKVKEKEIVQENTGNNNENINENTNLPVIENINNKVNNSTANNQNNNTNNKITNTGNNVTINNKSSEKPTKLPKAGDINANEKVKIVAISIVGTIAIFSYILYKKYKKY